MPFSIAKPSSTRAASFATLLLLSSVARAAALPSVASINLCADQLVLTVAAPEQVLTVSWLSADPEESLLAEQAKRKGAPLDWFVIPPAIARATAEGLARNAPHPYAAVLFYDYLISGAQPIFAGRQFIPVSRNLQPQYDVGPLKLIDSAAMLDQSRKWQELFQKTIIGPSR